MSTKVVQTGTLETRCNELVKYVWEHLNANGEPPTHREICAALRISPNTLSAVIRYAAERGVIVHRPGQRRGLRVKRVAGL